MVELLHATHCALLVRLSGLQVPDTGHLLGPFFTFLKALFYWEGNPKVSANSHITYLNWSC